MKKFTWPLISVALAILSSALAFKLWTAGYLVMHPTVGTSGTEPRLPQQSHSPSPERSPLLINIKTHTVLPGSAFWNGAPSGATAFVYYKGKRFPPSTIYITNSRSGAIGLFAAYQVLDVPLPLKLPHGCDDGHGDLTSGCYAQLDLVDFAKTGIPDVVVAIGNGNGPLLVNVIRYYPPHSAANVSRAKNWKLIGAFSGQRQAFVGPSEIKLPYGPLGAMQSAWFFVFKSDEIIRYTGFANFTSPLPEWYMSKVAISSNAEMSTATPGATATDYASRYAAVIMTHMLGGVICDNYKRMIITFARADEPENIKLMQINHVVDIANRVDCLVE